MLNDRNFCYQYDAFGRMEQAEILTGRVQKNRYDVEGLRHEMEDEMAKEINFFMTRADLLCVLQKVEEVIELKYIENKAYYSKKYSYL